MGLKHPGHAQIFSSSTTSSWFNWSSNNIWMISLGYDSSTKTIQPSKSQLWFCAQPCNFSLSMPYNLLRRDQHGGNVYHIYVCLRLLVSYQTIYIQKDCGFIQARRELLCTKARFPFIKPVSTNTRGWYKCGSCVTKSTHTYIYIYIYYPVNDSLKVFPERYSKTEFIKTRPTHLTTKNLFPPWEVCEPETRKRKPHGVNTTEYSKLYPTLKEFPGLKNFAANIFFLSK